MAAVEAGPGAFDVVLMDVMMPEMDGLEAMLHISALAPKLPVVLSSGYSAHELPPGVRSLAKPWDVQRLEALLREVTTPAP